MADAASQSRAAQERRWHAKKSALSRKEDPPKNERREHNQI
jgi:hypothetical protein